MNDLEVDGELLAVVVEDENTETAAAGLESILQTAPEVGLVNDGEVLLDIAGLGHGDDEAILDIEDAILLEDRTEHGLDDDGRSRVGDEGGLLVQLLGEEVDTKVAVLAGGRGGRDADDLAGAALEDQEVTQTDVVAGDGDGVGNIAITAAAATAVGAGWTGRLVGSRCLHVNVHVNVLMVVVAGVSDAVSQLVDSLAEGVVVA